MAKQLVFSDEARRGILEGVTLLAKAVKATLGPKGRNVAIEKKYGAPSVTKDGVSVAKEIELNDPVADIGTKTLCMWSRQRGKTVSSGYLDDF